MSMEIYKELHLAVAEAWEDKGWHADLAGWWVPTKADPEAQSYPPGLPSQKCGWYYGRYLNNPANFRGL